LAQDFKVDLMRPRERSTLNFNPDFKKLRNSVTKFMISVNEEAKLLRTSRNLKCPDIEPISLAHVG
jgi:nitrate/nitrite transport system ATP-binding protein